MRIISQDKQTDIPYEQATLIIEEINDDIWNVLGYMGDKYFYIGYYHSLVDAKSVLWAIGASKKAGKDYFEAPSANENLEYAYREM